MDNGQRNLKPESDLPFEDTNSSQVFAGAALGLATSLGGGFLCGWMIDQFGSIGSISLWVLGFLAGLAATKVTQRRNKMVAYMLIVACILAFIIAEVCWIHWNIVGAETWPAALSKLPMFFKEFKVDAFIAVICLVFGIQSLHRQIAD